MLSFLGLAHVSGESSRIIRVPVEVAGYAAPQIFICQ